MNYSLINSYGFIGFPPFMVLVLTKIRLKIIIIETIIAPHFFPISTGKLEEDYYDMPSEVPYLQLLNSA